MKNTILALGFLLLFACKKDIPQKQLVINVTPDVGGTVSPSSGTYAQGSTVKILATPSAEYIFKEWTGGFSGSSNPANVIMDADKTITCVFEKRQYPLSLNIIGEGTVKEEIIKTASNSTNYTSGTTVRLTPQPNTGFQFKNWSGDNNSSTTPLDIIISKATNLTCNFEKMAITSLKIENQLDTLIISKKHKYIVKGIYTNGTTIDLSDSVKITASSTGVNLLNDKSFIGSQSGSTILNLAYNNLSVRDTAYISEIEEIKNIDSYLITPVSGAKIIVPIVIINYYATLNGIDIDTKRQPSYGSLDPITIENLKAKTLDELKLTKYGLEEGSKFRGFNNLGSTSNIGIKVVKYYNIYEIKKIMSADKVNYFADFNDMFSKLNIKNTVENLGAKEVWFSLRPLSSEYPVVKSENLSPENFQAGGPESNMSSPTSGDVSNSWRIADDLPIYNKTYVVYTYNLHRSHAENIHNHGHQIEAQLDRLDEGNYSKDERLFLNKFVGISNINFNGKPYGRNGMTHFPPNTKTDYDWNNTTIVKSDIDDWKPEGGSLKDVNNEKWMSIKYAYPSVSYKIDENDSQYKWIMFWFQTLPGSSNGIKYGNYTISNWWDLLYNWDDAIKNKKKLYE